MLYSANGGHPVRANNDPGSGGSRQNSGTPGQGGAGQAGGLPTARIQILFTGGSCKLKAVRLGQRRRKVAVPAGAERHLLARTQPITGTQHRCCPTTFSRYISMQVVWHCWIPM